MVRHISHLIMFFYTIYDEHTCFLRRSEINLGVERSGFTLVRFHKGIPEHDPYVRVSMIKLKPTFCSITLRIRKYEIVRQILFYSIFDIDYGHYNEHIIYIGYTLNF